MMEENPKNIKCEYCSKYLDYHPENLYYPNNINSILAICNKCVNLINSKLFVKVDMDKIQNIKKKAKEKYLNNKLNKV